MKIELHKITVRELTEGYVDNQEAGVKAYGGKLDVRPPFQREFVYNDKERDAVIDTITQDFPLNVMYWSVNDDGTFEIIDGQQRTVSICQYVNGDFAHLFRYFDNLTKEEKDQILNYELYIYRCTGSDKEKLKWFKTINIAGKKLTNQELLNAVYASPWSPMPNAISPNPTAARTSWAINISQARLFSRIIWKPYSTGSAVDRLSNIWLLTPSKIPMPRRSGSIFNKSSIGYKPSSNTAL